MAALRAFKDHRRSDAVKGGSLRSLDIVGSALAVTAVLHDVEAQLLAFGDHTQAATLHRGDMHEHVLTAIIGANEAKTLRCIEEFYSSNCHDDFLSISHKVTTRNTECGASQPISILKRKIVNDVVNAETKFSSKIDI